MRAPSRTHLVVIPTYDTGPQLLRTVQAARAVWAPVWVVVDGSTDGSDATLEELVDRRGMSRGTALASVAVRAAGNPHRPSLPHGAENDGPADGFRVLRHARNRGKGAAVLTALEAAAAAGFTHVLTMDADGQHPAGSIGVFMAASEAQPAAMVLGVPVFGPDAPLLRVRGRKISNWWVSLETLGAIGDSLFGFRVYPIAPLRRIMRRNLAMKRFDFDPEAAVRLSWAGVSAVNLPAPVRYLTAAEGGVSHFRYGRDNALLTGMHIRLMLGFLWRLPLLAWRRWRRRGHRAAPSPPG